MRRDRFTLRCAVYAILIRRRKILLLRRARTGWMDGKYSLPAGHLEDKESVIDALARETREEVGIMISLASTTLVHTMHRRSLYVDLFFTVGAWSGEIINAEPNKHDELRWCPIAALPENTAPSVRKAIEAYRAGLPFSEMSHETGA